jgi:hypothetical protein
MASISSSRRAVSRASGVPLARAEIALPFNLLAGVCKAAAPGDLAFFVVAMLLFPHAACDKMTAVCLAFIHRSGKGGSGSSGRSAIQN